LIQHIGYEVYAAITIIFTSIKEQAKQGCIGSVNSNDASLTSKMAYCVWKHME